MANVDRRTVLNISSVLTPMKILMEHSDLEFPFNYHTAKQALIRSAKLTISVQHQSDEVEQYFHVLQSLVNLYKLTEDVHYKIVVGETQQQTTLPESWLDTWTVQGTGTKRRINHA